MVSGNPYTILVTKTHRIHVWYIWSHLPSIYPQCYYIYHTWILWEMDDNWGYPYRKPPDVVVFFLSAGLHLHFPRDHGDLPDANRMASRHWPIAPQTLMGENIDLSSEYGNLSVFFQWWICWNMFFTGTVSWFITGQIIRVSHEDRACVSPSSTGSTQWMVFWKMRFDCCQSILRGLSIRHWEVPSGKLTVCYWKCPKMKMAMKNDDFP